jgi:serine/threonine-protein kinase
VTRARLDLNPAAELHSGGIGTVVLPAGGARTALAWSPNGRTLAFIGIQNGVRQAYVRDLDHDVARPLAGTEGARALTFSPDGEEVAFWANDALYQIKISGGPTAKICDVSSAVNGVAWGATRIVFSQGSLWLFELSAAGGRLRLLRHPKDLIRYMSPSFLPGEQSILYTEVRKQWTSGDERVMVLSLEGNADPKEILKDAADARYLPTGHLAFLRHGTLFVVPFDVQSLEVRGDPVPIVQDVAQAAAAWDSDDLTLAGQFAISPQGTLAYVSSPLPSYPDRELVTVDRRGNVTPLGAPLAGYRNHLALSPDGTKLAVSIQTTTDIQLFAYDIARHSLSRIASLTTGEVIVAAWSRDDEIAAGIVADGKIVAAVVRPDVTATPEILVDSTGFWGGSWSPDGRLVGVSAGGLWVYPPHAGNESPKPFLKWGGKATQPAWSPDGRWVAYTVLTPGGLDVNMRPFQGSGDAIQLSTNGGSAAAWNPNGRELFYLEAGREQDRMMAVSLPASGHPGRPEALFSFPRGDLFFGTTVLTPYAVALDGQHFYAIKKVPRESTPVTYLNVVFNWFEELKARVR